jgi:hypothetical protein
MLAPTKGEERKSNLLQQLRSGSAKELTLPVAPSSDVEFHSELCHLLCTNTSVSKLRIRKQQTASSATEMTERDWALLLPAFPQIAERIKRLHVSSYEPIFLVPTLLWNFRKLQHLVLDGITELKGVELESLASALRQHPSLQSFVLRQHELSDPRRGISSYDVVIKALVTAPKLTKFCQEGIPEKRNGSNKTRMQGKCLFIKQRPSSLVHLLGTRRLQYFRFAHLRFYHDEDYGVEGSSVGGSGRSEKGNFVTELAKKVLLSGVKTMSLANSGLEPNALATVLNVGVLVRSMTHYMYSSIHSNECMAPCF